MQRQLDLKFRSTIAKCDICFNLYNRDKHLPVIICSMHHTICKDCLDVLRHGPTCPFCRQTVSINKVAINNYILELLPQNVKPNVRQQMSERQSDTKIFLSEYNAFSHDISALSYRNSDQLNGQQNRREDQLIPNQNSINSRPPQYIYPDGFEDDGEQEVDPRTLSQMLAWHKFSTFLVTVAQLPFIVVDFCLVAFYSYSNCMDSPHGLFILILRPWLAIACVTSVLLLSFMVIINSLQTKGYLSLREMLKYGSIVIDICLGKLVIWGGVELALLVEIMLPYCPDQISGYGIVLLFFHFMVSFLYICHKVRAVYYRQT